MVKARNFSFQGVKGAYSELAGKSIYPEATAVSCNTFEDMFNVVKEEKVDRAIVPIENSLAGRVADTQRLIPDSGLKIIAEYILYPLLFHFVHSWFLLQFTARSVVLLIHTRPTIKYEESIDHNIKLINYI